MLLLSPTASHKTEAIPHRGGQHNMEGAGLRVPVTHTAVVKGATVAAEAASIQHPASAAPAGPQCL